MKRALFAAVAIVLLASCTTTTKTARTESVPYSMYNATVADLKVGERVIYSISPSREIQKGGIANCKRAVIQECLTANGNADLMLEPEFVISHKKGPFGIFINKVTNITVSGRPATYVNFRSMNDTVWTDPVFRGKKESKISFLKGDKRIKLNQD